MNTVTIEYLKAQYVAISEDCTAHYKRIQKALLNCNDIDKVRVGYNSKWILSNKISDFLLANNINYWTNYGSQTIDCPFNL